MHLLPLYKRNYISFLKHKCVFPWCVCDSTSRGHVGVSIGVLHTAHVLHVYLPSVCLPSFVKVLSWILLLVCVVCSFIATVWMC